jgi:hypothetical protein
MNFAQIESKPLQVELAQSVAKTSLPSSCIRSCTGPSSTSLFAAINSSRSRDPLRQLVEPTTRNRRNSLLCHFLCTRPLSARCHAQRLAHERRGFVLPHCLVLTEPSHQRAHLVFGLVRWLPRHICTYSLAGFLIRYARIPGSRVHIRR